MCALASGRSLPGAELRVFVVGSAGVPPLHGSHRPVFSGPVVRLFLRHQPESRSLQMGPLLWTHRVRAPRSLPSLCGVLSADSSPFHFLSLGFVENALFGALVV